MSHPKNLALLGAALLTALAIASGPARADEIVVRDLATGQESTVRCFDVTSETWSEVKYRERERGAEKSVPTMTVIAIHHTSDKSKNAQGIEAAMGELDRRNYTEAARQFQGLSGGGWKMDFETNRRTGYVSFAENDPPGRNRRPSWVSEYAQFFYAKAKLLQGQEAKDRQALEDALLAVDDVPVPGGDGKQTTGGFLGRFADGNSRFYPEALWIKSQALVALDRYDDAAKTFTELYQQSGRVPLGPRWAYEGMIGPGLIAEAKGDYTAAVAGYRGAMPTMEVLLERETRSWLMREYGRYRALAHTRVAAVMLKDAEESKSPPKFSNLRSWIQKGSPAEVRTYAAGKGWPKERIDALVAGSRDPNVQAVGLTGMGLAYLNEPQPRYEEALLAFKAVTVKYFQVPEQHARALKYLAEAADGAAKASTKPEVKQMYETMAREARERLRTR